MKKILAQNGTLIALIIISLISVAMSPTFFTPDNISNLTRQVAVVGILSVGMTMVILLAGIDLSIGSMVALTGVVLALLLQAGLPWWLSLLITLAVCGLLIGAWNALWIARLRIPPFIITLGMMTIARGAAHLLTRGSAIPIYDTTIRAVGNGFLSRPLTLALLLASALVLFAVLILEARRRRQFSLPVDLLQYTISAVIGSALIGLLIWVFLYSEGMPISAALMALTALGGSFVLQYTRFGRQVYATGGNEEASRLSGIPTTRVTFVVYILMTALTVIGGLISSSRLQGGSPNEGNMLELDVIAAVVIGGTSLTGGFGTVRGSIIGTFIMGILNNGMSLRGIDSNVQNLIKGFIIISAVAFDVLQKKGSFRNILKLLKSGKKKLS